MSATSQKGTCSLFQLVEVNDRQVYCEVACKVLFLQAWAEWDKTGPFAGLQPAVEPCHPATDPPLKGNPAALQQPQLPLGLALLPLLPLPSLPTGQRTPQPQVGIADIPEHCVCRRASAWLVLCPCSETTVSSTSSLPAPVLPQYPSEPPFWHSSHSSATFHSGGCFALEPVTAW